MNEMPGNLFYSINEKEKTASVTSVLSDTVTVIIPRTFNYKSVEYTVTKISEHAFSRSKITSIEFSPDTELQIIEDLPETIQNIIIPSSVTELKGRWCSQTKKLSKIEVDPNNPRYKSYGDLIIGKSDINQEEYDLLVFCSRTIHRSIEIPHFIKIILPFAFSHCHFSQIYFPSNSELHSICYSAFSNSKIEYFQIPSKLIDLQEGWCEYAYNLKKIEVSNQNPRYSNEGNCLVIGKSNINQDDFDVLVFCNRQIDIIQIPSSIKIIGSYSFDGSDIEKVEFLNDSKLEKIEKNAFNCSKIECFTFPSSVTYIGKKAFDDCISLETIEFQENSKLEIIDDSAFAGTSLVTFSAPSNLKIIGNDVFGSCKYLETIIFPDDSQIHTIGSYTFYSSEIVNFTIPHHLTTIDKEVFAYCSNIKKINIPENNSLNIIEEKAFQYSSIESFIVPLHLTKICEGAFHKCEHLKEFEIPFNCNLQTIELDAFSDTSIESLFVPSSLVNLEEGWCHYTLKLNRIEICPNHPRYKSYGENMIIGKSNIEQDEYDVLVFVSRSIKTIQIPSFIKIIGSYAFDSCMKLDHVEIPKNSKLDELDDYAFNESSIVKFSIPSNIKRIGIGCFAFCESLRIVEIPMNSELQIIDDDTFIGTAIKSLVIPSKIKKLGIDSFTYDDLHIVEIADSSLLEYLVKIIKKNKQNLLILVPN